MVEFAELRNSQDLAYHLQRQAIIKKWGGSNAKHLISSDVRVRHTIHVYDYDIKASLLLLAACSLFFLFK